MKLRNLLAAVALVASVMAIERTVAEELFIPGLNCTAASEATCQVRGGVPGVPGTCTATPDPCVAKATPQNPLVVGCQCEFIPGTNQEDCFCEAF
jgi:hypothetical protein